MPRCTGGRSLRTKRKESGRRDHVYDVLSSNLTPEQSYPYVTESVTKVLNCIRMNTLVPLYEDN